MGRFAVVAAVFGALAGPPAVAPAAAAAVPDADWASVALASSQNSGSRSRDMTGDGVADIVARQPGWDDGALWVYPGSGVLNGRSTLTGRAQIGRGWNIFNWIGVAEVTGDTEETETIPEMPGDVLARRATDGALLVYPHSGTYNGFNTLQSPVVIGTGWNIMHSIVLADLTGDGFDDIVAYDTSDNTWLYPHSRVFNGTSTFGARILVREGRIGWLYATEWSNDFPDLVGLYFATGAMYASPHRRKVNGTGTWGLEATELSRDQFTNPLVDLVILTDLTGDGRDDLVVRQLDGVLRGHAFNQVSEINAFGPSVVIGDGWHVMDMIT
jgi:hypothetical protein